MNFSEAAAKWAAQTALHLGWRPDEFWNATPAELVGILQTLAGHNEAPPTADAIAELMTRFPDAPSGDI